MPLLLSRDELKPLLDLNKAIELIEDDAPAAGERPDSAPCAVPYSGRRP